MRIKGIISCLSVLLLAQLSGLCPAAGYSFSGDPGKWQEVVFPGSDSIQPECRFDIKNDPIAGTVFSVGPWIAGKWSARYQYLPKIPITEGMVTGYYRTTGLLPFQAAATVTFFDDESPIAKKKYDLSPSSGWKKFIIKINSPRGTEYLTVALGLEEKTDGVMEFSRVKLTPEIAGKAFNKLFIPAVKIRPISNYEPGKSYQLQKYLDNYWLIDPAGRALYASGIGGFDLKHPGDQVNEIAQRLFKCRFNCLSATARDVEDVISINQEIDKLNGNPLMVFYTIESSNLNGFEYLKDSNGSVGSAGHAFPDPYDPAFEKAYTQHVVFISEMLKDKKWFAGWFADNDLSHADLFLHVYSGHCGRAFVEFLRDKYKNVNQLNQAWKRNYPAFENILIEKPAPGDKNSGQYRDFLLFERQVVQKYIEITVHAIRNTDPGRLIFSNRFISRDVSAYTRLLDLYSKYDALALNLYPSNDTAGLSDNEKAYVRMFHDLAGRPVFISEWSVPALDSDLYNTRMPDWSWAQAVKTQKNRADQSMRVMMELYNMPFVIGADWFCWKDINTSTRKANRGLVNDRGIDWLDLQDQFRQTNSYICR